MNKQYYVVNSSSNLVEQIVLVEETQISTLYPDSIIVPVSMEIGAPRYYPGCLYHNSMFWAPFVSVTPENTSLSQYQFRELFTTSEMITIDNFNTDAGLSDQNKKILNSFTKTLQSAMVISMVNQYVIDGLNFLVTIGYLTEARKTAILNMEKPV